MTDLLNRGSAPNSHAGADSWYTTAGKINDFAANTTSLLSRTINAGAKRFESGATNEARIALADAACVAELSPRLYIPAFMLPYDITLCPASSGVQRIREGGDSTVYDLRAYGASGNGIADDTASIVAAYTGAPSGSVVYAPVGTYNHTALNWSKRVNLFGWNSTGTIFRYTPTSGTAWTIDPTWQPLQGPVFAFRGVTLRSTSTTNPPTGTTTGMLITTNFFTAVDCIINTWGTTALTFGNNANLLTFQEVSMHENNQCINYPAGLTNAGEGFTFIACAFANSGTTASSVHVGLGAGDLNFHSCSFDNAQLLVDSGVVGCFGCHFEAPGGAISVPFISQTGGMLTIFGGHLVMDTDATCTTAIALTDSNDFLYSSLWIYGLYGASTKPAPVPLLTVSGTAPNVDISVMARAGFSKIVSGPTVGGLISFRGRLGLNAQTVFGRAMSILTDAAAIATDASLSEIFQVTLGGNRSMSTPTNPTTGQRITYLVIQDGTGGRTLSFAGIFKVSWSDTGNTAGKRSSISVIYDGASWNQDGAQTPYV